MCIHFLCTVLLHVFFLMSDGRHINTGVGCSVRLAYAQACTIQSTKYHPLELEYAI